MSPASTRSGVGASHRVAVDRFSRVEVATKYPAVFTVSAHDRRERACILRGLESVRPGAHVLDLPCGAGRLTWELLKEGYQVTAVDSSAAMIDKAQGLWPRIREEFGLADAAVRFQVGDVMATGFADRQFEAVVCNRLFHHFTEPATRQAALRELGRICRGPIVVSFFNTFALDAVQKRLRHWLRHETPTDRIPIPLGRLASEGRSVGLVVEKTNATLWGISRQWYAVFRNARTA